MFKLNPDNVEDITNLSYFQKGLLFFYLQNPDSLQYFEEFEIQFEERLDANLVLKTWKLLQQGNQILRAIYRWQGLSKPVQIILKHMDLKMDVYEGMEGVKYKSELLNIRQKMKEDRVSLTDMPFKIGLVQMGTESRMIIHYHHILMDGWSNSILLKSFLEIYQQLTQGKVPNMKEKVKYKTFITWQQQLVRENALEYWKEKRNSISISAIPTDFVKGIKGSQYNHYIKELNSGLFDKIKSFSERNRITLATVFYAAWAITISNISGQKNVIFGTIVSGRTSQIPNCEEIVGPFINTIPLIVAVDQNSSLIDLLQLIADDLNDERRNDNIPLDVVNKCINNEDGKFFNTLMNIQNYPIQLEQSENNGLHIKEVYMNETTHYDITVCVQCMLGGRLYVPYNRDLFLEETIEKIMSTFIGILENIEDNCSARISSLDCMIEDVMDILSDFNEPLI